MSLGRRSVFSRSRHTVCLLSFILHSTFSAYWCQLFLSLSFLSSFPQLSILWLQYITGAINKSVKNIRRLRGTASFFWLLFLIVCSCFFTKELLIKDSAMQASGRQQSQALITFHAIYYNSRKWAFSDYPLSFFIFQCSLCVKLHVAKNKIRSHRNTSGKNFCTSDYHLEVIVEKTISVGMFCSFTETTCIIMTTVSATWPLLCFTLI